ncbi:hypothetical protein B0O80DRAFT_119555 [Mortierella sp. GBAus27b]|nr:hypothetical protein B0O80DRAFT_119555 [Mortierella sp. GBAus27b]
MPTTSIALTAVTAALFLDNMFLCRECQCTINRTQHGSASCCNDTRFLVRVHANDRAQVGLPFELAASTLVIMTSQMDSWVSLACVWLSSDHPHGLSKRSVNT